MSQAKAANRGPMDAFLWQKDQSLFFPRAWKTVANYSYEMVPYPPQSAGNFGTTSTFLIPNNVATYLGKIVWEGTISRGSNGDSGVTDLISFDNYLAYSMIEQVKVTYGQNDVDILDGEFMFWKFYEERMDEYKRTAMEPLVWGSLSKVERAALYDNGIKITNPIAAGTVATNFKVRIELPVWHTRSLQQYMPQVLGSEIFYKIKFRPLSEIMQSRGTAAAGVSITDQNLYVEQVYAGPDEQSRLHFAAQNGILQLHDRQQIQTVVDPSGALPQGFGTRIVQVKLDNFNTATSYLLVAIRDAEQLNQANRVDRWTLRGRPSVDGRTTSAVGTGGDVRYRLSDITLKSSNGEIKRKIPIELVYPIQWSHTRSGPGIQGGLIAIDLGKNPLPAGDAYGSLNLGLITAPILELTFVEGDGVTGAETADATRIEANNHLTNDTSTIRVDVYGTVKNLNFYKGGNLYTQFQ